MIIDMDYKNEIGHLLQKYFSGTIMPDEQRLLDSWMKEKEEHKQLFDRLRKDTRFAEEYGIFREVDTTRAWETFRVKNGLRRQRRMTTWIKYASFYSEPTTLTYEQSGKSFSCQIMNQGLEFPVAGTPMPGWSDYSDFDKYVQNPQRFIVKMKKRQQ